MPGSLIVTDRLLAEMNAAQVSSALKTVVSPDTLLCSRWLRYLAQRCCWTRRDCEVAVTYHGRVQDRVYHVRTVNNYHARLKA
jgi:hypothetical protein